ncbi:L-aspartate oxidase [Arthrobacter sp. KK5.5]|uniref:L-aspartate oxidase n=1 Tax=Arthrobacter sp. KK5.5 TaxID=3373084 RepID=UPI003EE74382
MSRRPSLAVVGSGIAGLYAAVVAVERGHEVRLLTKDRLGDSNTWYAQGGLSAVGPQGRAGGDSIGAHVADTLVAGARLGDPRAVRMVCAAAWGHVERLALMGMAFDADASRGGEPLYRLGLEGAHSRPRILHASGDATGRAIAQSLIAVCRRLESEGRLAIEEGTFVHALEHDAGRVAGVRATGGSSGHGSSIRADAVLLATGGIGVLYPWTTNPAGATGDGAALAWNAGAAIADAEFVQFHPTLVPDGPFMVSEAVRGEGAVLLDGTGHRFMPGLHPDAELAPRDVVARAIHRVRAATGAVYLDATTVEADRGRGFLAGRFPGITSRLRELGHDLAVAPVPVAEAQHYWMGGIVTDAHGRTTIPGLLAAGETACTGAHGANRLASNSLLEGLVYAWTSVVALSNDDGRPPAPLPGDMDTLTLAEPAGTDSGEPQSVDLAALHSLTGRALAVEREEGSLRVAAKQLTAWSAPAGGRPRRELAHLLTVGRIIAAAALARENSLGAHHRTDFPQPPASLARRALVKTGQ